MILNYNHPSDVSIGTFEAHLTATFENALSLLSRVICGDFVACGDTGMRWMDDFGWQWENWGCSTSPLIVQPASPLNEPEDADDEEDGDSEGDDDYYFDNQSTGTVKRHS